MTDNKRRPVIGKLLVTRSGCVQVTGSSPRGPLDLKNVSPREGLICIFNNNNNNNNNNMAGGVGLGILAHIHIEQQEEEEEDEEYTIVTRHLPNDNSYRKVVYDGNGKTMKTIFDISPAPARVDHHTKADDFLSCCHQCKKQLEGRDVYMYRGERAFCSIECRCMEIWMEERNCSSQASSSYSCDMYLSATDTTGIFAI